MKDYRNLERETVKALNWATALSILTISIMLLAGLHFMGVF